MYAVLGYLVFRALEQSSSRAGAIALAIALCAAWGAIDEWHQIFVPGRAAELQDWMADVVGGMIGASVRALRHRPTTARGPA
jgi:VanZ family protein